MQLRCTQKLLKELGIKKNELADIEVSNTLLGDWYANIFTLDRRKTIIFMNEKTLFSFIIYGVKKSTIQEYPIMFVNEIKKIFTMEGINIILTNIVLNEYKDIAPTKTNNKSLLGNLNDLISLYKHIISSRGGTKHIDLYDVIARINRTPQRTIGWKFSIDTIQNILSVNDKKT